MYKVLLVDDDLNICKGLQRLIDWNECGFEVAGIAKNGQEAYTMCTQDSYDLVVTDIKMPVMDGLSLIKKLRNDGYPAQLIIVSAYGEFSYAQEAIQYGVAYYLLKPVEEMVLEGYLSRIKELLDDHGEAVGSISSIQFEEQYKLSSNGVIPEIKNFIRMHYSEQISINTLADMYNFSPVYLGRVFKRNTGKTFNEYLKNIRINAACEILDSYPDVSISDLAEKVGYYDLNYFYKLFKQVTGSTPKEYKTQK
ncbi:MAG: response regulator [Lachnospiraceae bacterium]|nr:response regulator [Lachnospiraceae bacterium]